MNENKDSVLQKKSVHVKAYFALIFAIIFFSGLLLGFKDVKWLTAFDFTTISGAFGTIKEPVKNSFLGAGGKGAREGFLFGFSLIPAVMLALGTIEILNYFGALQAAQILLTPLLRPIMGVPGSAGVTLVTDLQSTDTGAVLTKQLFDEGVINEKERITMISWQFSAAGTITNYFASGPALFAVLTVPIIVPLAVIIIMKFVGANITRLLLYYFYKEDFKNDNAHSV